MKKLLRNKKGSPLDNLVVAMELFAFAFVLLFLLLSWNKLTTPEVDEAIWDKTTEGGNIKQDAQRAYDQFDNIFVMAYIGLHLGVLVMAYFLRNHPVILVVVFLITLVAAVVFAPLSNVWQETIEDTDDLRTAVSALPKTHFILSNYPKFEIIWLILTGIVMAGVARID